MTKSKFAYLGDKNWHEITRDERTFCMYLFQVFEEKPEILAKLILDLDIQISLAEQSSSLIKPELELKG